MGRFSVRYATNHAYLVVPEQLLHFIHGPKTRDGRGTPWETVTKASHMYAEVREYKWY